MKTRDDVLAEGVKACLNALYYYAVPSTSYDALLEAHKNHQPYDKEFWQHHYLPDDLCREIVDTYKSAYGIEPYFKDYSNVIKEYLFEGGKKEVYKDNLRDYEDTLPLKEVIGEEAAEKVKELFEDCQNFYRFDSRDSNAFDFTVFDTAPTSNPKTVMEYWKDIYLDLDADHIKKNFYKEEYGDDYEG